MSVANKKQFYDLMWPLVEAASKITGVLPEVIYAQSADETGYGLHAPGNNYFGIKSTTGQGLINNTLEYINGSWRQERDVFDGYPSMAASVAGWVRFISGKRYAAFRGGRTITDQLAALQASGYATDPRYSAKLAAIIATLPTPVVVQVKPVIPPVKSVTDTKETGTMTFNLVKLLQTAGSVIEALADVAPIPAPAQAAVTGVINGLETVGGQIADAVTAVKGNVSTATAAIAVGGAGNTSLTEAQIISAFEGSALQLATKEFTELLPQVLEDIAAGNLTLPAVVLQAETDAENVLTMAATKGPTEN